MNSPRFSKQLRKAGAVFGGSGRAAWRDRRRAAWGKDGLGRSFGAFIVNAVEKKHTLLFNRRAIGPPGRKAPVRFL